MKTIEIKESIPHIGDYDIIVAGGGVAGVAAAVSARRMGRNVLLIEKTISLGGLATIGLVNWFVPMCDGRGTQIIKGMNDELLQLAIKYGYDTIPEEWKNDVPEKKSRYVSKFSHGVFTLALTEFIKDEGVEILFDTIISKPVMEGNHCAGLIVENKSGRSYYGAKIVVDTTGDADVLYRAGVPTIQGNNYNTFFVFGANMNSCKTAIEKEDISRLLVQYYGGNANLYGKNHPEGKPFWKGTDGADVTNYIVENHIEVLNKIKKDDRKTRDIVTVPAMAQFRTTRRIDGDYTLTPDDAYKHFDDSIAAICDFDRKDYLFEIPYRTLVKTGFDNLITAGRSISGEGYAWDVVRVIPPAIITGQAAGNASALAIQTGKSIIDIDVKELQGILESQNVLIHFNS